MGACFVRRFSLNALSVPPLGQVQTHFGLGVGPLGGSWGALGRSWDVLGRLWAFFDAFWALLPSLELQVLDFLGIFGRLPTIFFAFGVILRGLGYFSKTSKKT